MPSFPMKFPVSLNSYIEISLFFLHLLASCFENSPFLSVFRFSPVFNESQRFLKRGKFTVVCSSPNRELQIKRKLIFHYHPSIIHSFINVYFIYTFQHSTTAILFDDVTMTSRRFISFLFILLTEKMQ